MQKRIVHDSHYSKRANRPVVDSPEQQVPASKTQRQHSPLVRALVRGTLIILLLAALIVGAVYLVLHGEQLYAGRIYPNVSVSGVDLSYHNADTARATLETHHAAFMSHPVELVYGDEVWHPSARELGLHMDYAPTLDAAVVLGRADTREDSLRSLFAIWDRGFDLPLHMHVDQKKLQAYVLEVAAAVDQPPRDARVHLEGAHVVVTPERFGLQVLVDETVRDITASMHNLTPQRIPLRTRTLAPSLRDTDVAPVVAQLRTLVSAPVVLTSNEAPCQSGCRWEWSPDQIADWIRINRIMRPDGRPNLVVSVDQMALQRELVPIASTVQRDGALPRVAWNGGNMQIIQEGTAGIGLDATRTLSFINTALWGSARSIDLPLTEIPPPVIASNLASLGITEAVGVGASSFIGSQPYRITNIRAGAARMNGILIPPGGTFSFNNALGPVDANGGFVQGAAIVQNRTQQEWGGGLCQVSTTMFRAAFWSGLPIVERHEHTFRIGWYEELGEPPGLDATIFTGVTDMKFVNDTGGWLLTEAWADVNRQRLYITLYGSPPAREVYMNYAVLSRTPAPSRPLYVDDPSRPRGTVKQTDWAQPGMTVEVYRTVLQDGQPWIQDSFLSVFEPWPNIFVRGTG